MRNKARWVLPLILLGIVSCGDQKQESTTKSEVKEETVALNLSTPDELYPELFVAVQLGGVFEDSKTFVDCTAKTSASNINAAYSSEKAKADFSLNDFVKQYFEAPPSISSDFKSDKSRSATEHVNALWPVLKRASDVKNDGSTLIPLPKSYIVPGGRFREVYYWDSYFTMLGLVESEKYDQIEDMLDNFAYLIAEVGHIPNGNRVYYKTRSQPPFFSQMVQLYAGVKGDEIYAQYAEALLAEYDFWMDGADAFYSDVALDKKDAELHVVKTDVGLVNRYFDTGITPRQESYREDYEQVESLDGGEKMYSDLRSGAESGWDYSSRWFADGETIGSIETTDIIPVDLNALLYGLEKILLNHTDLPIAKRGEIMTQMESRMNFLNQYMEAPDGTFADYNYVKGKQTGIKSLAMVYPLYFKMADARQASAVAASIEKTFLKPGGVVTSPYNTGQQWDAPNGWAPLQWMTIQGLRNYGHDDLASEIATRWVAVNERVYENTGKFVEKYNVEDMSLLAGGGEYPVQDGFGWSNGVYLALKAYLTDKQ